MQPSPFIVLNRKDANKVAGCGQYLAASEDLPAILRNRGSLLEQEQRCNAMPDKEVHPVQAGHECYSLLQSARISEE